MKWALIVIGGIVGLVLIVAAVGAMLPRNHVASLSARILAPPEKVWATVTAPSEYPKWRSDVEAIEMLPAAPTGPSWREHSRSGPITFVMEVAEPPRRLVTRIADTDVPFGGTWECLIVPEGDNYSRVTITERGFVSNPIFRFIARFFIGYTGTIDSYLRALGRHFGAEPIPVVVPVAGGGRGL